MTNQLTFKEIRDFFIQERKEELDKYNFGGLSMPSLSGYVSPLTVSPAPDGMKVEKVNGQLLEPDKSTGAQSRLKDNNPQEEKKSFDKTQFRHELVYETLCLYFDFNCNDFVKEGSVKIGKNTAKQYLFEFEYKGKPLTMIVTNWYGNAVYITNSANYYQGVTKMELRQHGTERIYWEDDTMTREKLAQVLKEKFDKLV